LFLKLSKKNKTTTKYTFISILVCVNIMEEAAHILRKIQHDPCLDLSDEEYVDRPLKTTKFKTDFRVRIAIRGKTFVFGSALSSSLAREIGTALLRSGFEVQKNIWLEKPKRTLQFSKHSGTIKPVYDAVQYALYEERRMGPQCHRVKLDRTNPAIDAFIQFVEEAAKLL